MRHHAEGKGIESRMHTSSQTAEARSPVSLRYRLLRGLVRAWFALLFRKVRLLRAEDMPESGPVILAVSHPASFLDALILVVAFERQIRCLLNRHLFRGSLRAFFARGLGMIAYDPSGVDRPEAFKAAGDVLGDREAVVVFADQQVPKAGEPPTLVRTASAIALETETRHSGQLGLSIFPVHLFLPIAQPRSNEVILYVDKPVFPQDYLSPEGSDASALGRLAAALEQAFRENAFRLQPDDVEGFLADLEVVLRVELEEEWSSRPNWRQKVEGFKLSGFIRDLVGQMNFLNPGRLVALREELDSYREEQRRCSLRQFEAESAGPWLKSPLHRLWFGIESLAGLPLATYGLINHIPAWILLFWTGLLKKESGRDRTLEWALRALVVLGCYAVQVLLCGQFLGRAAAGYYVLTLPLSGVYLWRYEWLLQRRTRLLLLWMGLTRRAAKLRRMRKQLIESLNAARDAYADMLRVPH